MLLEIMEVVYFREVFGIEKKKTVREGSISGVAL